MSHESGKRVLMS